MHKSNTPLKRVDLFTKYKGDFDIFFETGTHHGDSVKTALNIGYKKVISVEIHKAFYLECEEKFKEEIDNKVVHLFWGDSKYYMEDMLSLVDSKAVFWLDGHIDGLNGDPVWPELKAIKNHPIKNHTIIIDDVPKYFGDGKILEQALLDINPNYKFVYEDALNESDMTTVYQNYDLVAYIE